MDFKEGSPCFSHGLPFMVCFLQVLKGLCCAFGHMNGPY